MRSDAPASDACQRPHMQFLAICLPLPKCLTPRRTGRVPRERGPSGTSPRPRHNRSPVCRNGPGFSRHGTAHFPSFLAPSQAPPPPASIRGESVSRYDEVQGAPRGIARARQRDPLVRKSCLAGTSGDVDLDQGIRDRRSSVAIRSVSAVPGKVSFCDLESAMAAQPRVANIRNRQGLPLSKIR